MSKKRRVGLAALAGTMLLSSVPFCGTSVSAADTIFNDTFEDGVCGWSGRGSAKVSSSGDLSYTGSKSLAVQGRADSWNGAQKELSSSDFTPGKAYSFSVDVAFSARKTESATLMLSLQYKDASGETVYDHIAQATTAKGRFVQLANPDYVIPDGATDLILYVETETGTDNLFIDDAAAAEGGASFDGPKEAVFAYGDINYDGRFDSFDMILARRGIVDGFKDKSEFTAADVDQDGEYNVADLIQINKYIMKRIDEFEVVEKPVEEGKLPNDTSMADYTAMVEELMVEYDPQDVRGEKPGVQYGTVVGKSYYSTTCNRQKKYNILLPAGYSEDKQYPVLYCMHGYYENQDRMIIKGNNTMYTRQLIGNAIANGDAEDMIVVFPDIYSSPTQAACSGMDENNNRAYDNFINDLVKDLMPEIEKNYSVKTGRENTAITGFSMGGRESLLIGMQRSDLFGYIGAICPAPGVSGAFKWAAGEEPYLLMITGGSNDTVVYTNPKTYHENFEKNGVPHIWHYVNGGYHGDNSIHAHLYNFVRGIFKVSE